MMSLFRSVTPAIPPCPRGPCGMQDFGLVPGSVRHLEGLHVSTGLRFGTLPSGPTLLKIFILIQELCGSICALVPVSVASRR